MGLPRAGSLMVLRIILLFFLTFLSTTSFGESEEYENLDLLYKLNDHDSVLGEISDLDELSYRNDYKIYELKALSLETKGEYEKAVEIYKNLIKTNFKNEISTLLRSMKKNKSNSEEYSKRMFFYYFKIAENYTKMYESLPDNFDRFKRSHMRSKANSYLKIARFVDETNDLVMRLYNRLEEKDKALRDQKYLRNYFLFMGIVSWQDHFKVNNGSESANVLNTTIGSCSGAGVRWANVKYEWILSGCYIMGKSTANTEEGAITFSQSKVSVRGQLYEAGVMTKAFADDLSFGLFFDVLSRTGDWDTASGYTLEETSYTRFGYSIKTKWDADMWSFSMGLGKVFKNESSFLQILTLFNF